MTSRPFVDVVVVAYNSRDKLHTCLEPLVGVEGVHTIVVDNASADGSADVATCLGATVVRLNENGGFASGCNAGWRAGGAPYVLFLNPDARITAASIGKLVDVLQADALVGITAPKIAEPGGALDFSQRRFPRSRSTFARAFFLHRVFPNSSWADELIRDPVKYSTFASPDWVSGACLLVRRTVLDELNGWDERFFMYCEDIDLCARTRKAGYDIRFVPEAIACHEGGESAPRAALLPTLAESRMVYARKHLSPLGRVIERGGLGMEAATHALLSTRGAAARRGHARALLKVIDRRDSAV